MDSQNMDNKNKEKNGITLSVQNTKHLHVVDEVYLFVVEMQKEVNKITNKKIFEEYPAKTSNFMNFAATATKNGVIIGKKFDKISKKEKTDELISNNKIKDIICPILKSGADDFTDICKNLVPVFATLAITGNLPFSITPVIGATAVVLIAKMGIAAYCKKTK